MAKIAYIILCHKDPDGIIAQAERLTAAGDFVAIHFDGRSDDAAFNKIRARLDGNPSVVLARRRIKCGWGEWSLVAATLAAVRAAVDAFPRATHFYMMSGDCMPIKSAEYAHALLDREEVDYIESVDFFKSDWIKTGIKAERLIYRHYFNERTHKSLFYASMALQQRLRMTRKVPADLEMQIGSQWWCLRRRTMEAVLAFCKERRDVMRFFKRTWIPDETFFQTLVRHLVPDHEIRSRTLTFLMFTDYGMPVTFYNDNYDLLLSQDYLFARKISADATELKQRLGLLYAAEGVHFPISNEGRSLFQFLTGRGRMGRRFAPRFWEAEATLGRDRTLLMVVCKKWHVAKRFVRHLHNATGIPMVEYVFDEASAALPDLGGIESTLEKRTRHRRALMRLLFDFWETDKLLVCIDPANIDLMRDFALDKATVRFLEVECDFTDDYLIGHARRVGLAGDRTPQAVIDRLLPTIRYDVKFESDQIRDADLLGLCHFRQSGAEVENIVSLAAFLDIGADQARDIAQTDQLFAD